MLLQISMYMVLLGFSYVSLGASSSVGAHASSSLQGVRSEQQSQEAALPQPRTRTHTHPMQASRGGVAHGGINQAGPTPFQRLDQLERQMPQILSRIAALEAKVNALESKINTPQTPK